MKSSLAMRLGHIELVFAFLDLSRRYRRAQSRSSAGVWLRILVTGGLGAVGHPLVDALSARGCEVFSLDRGHSSSPNYLRCDVGQFRQLKELFDSRLFDMVYHLAAEFGRRNGEDFYEELWRTNAIGTKNILKLQEQFSFRLIFFSSSEVYGDFPGLMAEDVLLTQPIRQLNDYAISKWVNEQQVMNAIDRFAAETVTVRLFNTYGPGEHYSPYRSVICQFIYKALHDLPYTVYLNHHRSSSYISDTVRTLANIVDNFRPGAVYNICGDEYHDIKTVSDMILGSLGKSDDLVSYVEREPFNTLNKRGDNSRAKAELDHKSLVSLDEGIDKTIAWQREVYGVA